MSGIDEGSAVLPVDTGDHLEPDTAPKLVSYQVVAKFSKLTTSLVNDLLKFQMALLQIHCYFLLKNVRILCIAIDSHIFSTKNNSVFAYVVGIYFTR